MSFFDGITDSALALLDGYERKTYDVSYSSWKDVGRNELILQRDSAYELEGAGFNLITEKKLEKDCVTVIGSDLPQIGCDTQFSRISLIELECGADEQKLYNLIRKVEYAKYHCFPYGYMMRTSSSTHTENVRVSKAALSRGLTFAKAGSLLVKKYRENEAVKAVNVIYVTDKNVDYGALYSLAEKNYALTQTLNHVMNSISLDCSSCNLKPICDEVEGMRELHFKNVSSMR